MLPNISPNSSNASFPIQVITTLSFRPLKDFFPSLTLARVRAAPPDPNGASIGPELRGVVHEFTSFVEQILSESAMSVVHFPTRKAVKGTRVGYSSRCRRKIQSSCQTSHHDTSKRTFRKGGERSGNEARQENWTAPSDRVDASNSTIANDTSPATFAFSHSGKLMSKHHKDH